jgi:beta-lactamase regulating signal transducer with metallopeptidase domain
MMLPALENMAQIAVAHVLNSLPEGILLAVITWIALRFLPRQNSRTRFAVWLVALLTVAGLPFVGALIHTDSLLAHDSSPSLFTLSGHWAFILFSVWLIAMCAAAMHLALGMFRLGALRRSCDVINPGDLPPALAEIAREFSVSHSVTLATSDRLTVPSAIGFFQPTIVIPAWALHELTPEEFRVILLHEFAHLHRRDDWTNLLQKSLRALFIFHPAVWWIERQLSLEREMACDDHVLAQTGNPRGYARCLVSLLERSFGRRALAMAQAAVRRADEARQRLARILDGNRISSKRFGRAAIGLAGILSLICFAAVPHAPELVAFAPSASELRATYAPVSDNSKFPSALVIPAAMHVRTTQAHDASLQASHRSTLTAHAIAAKAKTTPVTPRVVRAKASERAVPAETILVIRTTEQIGPDAWISRVTVWHLIWAPTHAQRVPASKTT